MEKYLNGECDEPAILQIDYINFFNSFFRKFARSALSIYLPKFIPYFDTLYQKHSPLYTGRHVLNVLILE